MNLLVNLLVTGFHPVPRSATAPRQRHDERNHRWPIGRCHRIGCLDPWGLFWMERIDGDLVGGDWNHGIL